MPNRLQFESSPYLLQHANNPVDWYPWGEEALELAKATNRPILVSIGYSTCHWCHVMEHESFEDEQVAKFMNKHFVNIKVDREERPDLDQLYMTACISINGSGGWPLNCFLLPDGRPFYGNTYFPPQSAYRRPSWSQVLQNIATHYNEKNDVVVGQAEQLMRIIKDQQGKKVAFDPGAATDAEIFDFASLENVFYKFRERFDSQNGGFGTAPKFPATHSLSFLLSYGLQFDNGEAIEHVRKSLLAMARGGIYDHLIGGFARYTVDAQWIIPHFEKMAYDNGLLLELIARYLKHFPEEEELRSAWLQTMGWLKKEMLGDALFYSALDADSEGVEGKFYVWTDTELTDLLSEKALAEMRHVFNLSAVGNWEEKNILYRTTDWPTLAAQLATSEADLKASIAASKAILLTARDLRIRPGLDDKQILSWNALLLSGLLAGKDLLDAEELQALKGWVDKVPVVFANASGNSLHRLFKAGIQKQDGFLEDYAFWINTLIDAYNVFWDLDYLKQAKHWMEMAIARFGDPEDAQFYFSPAEQTDSVHRSKEKDDGALPSANGKMARALWYLGVIFDEADWRSRAIQQLQSIRELAERYPVSMGHWLQFGLELQADLPEIAIVGPSAQEFAKVILANLKLRPIIMVNDIEQNEFPLLRERQIGQETYINICKQYTCHIPMQTTSEAIQLLKDI